MGESTKKLSTLICNVYDHNVREGHSSTMRFQSSKAWRGWRGECKCGCRSSRRRSVKCDLGYCTAEGGEPRLKRHGCLRYSTPGKAGRHRRKSRKACERMDNIWSVTDLKQIAPELKYI